MENYEMLWIIVTASITGLLSIYFGYQRRLYLHQINARNLSITAVIGLAVFTGLLLLYRTGIMSEEIGAAIISNVYASLAGFFGGAAFNQYQSKRNAGDVRYAHRSFLTDHASVIMALGVILFGVFRTSLFTDLAITPIRVTSGLSFIAFGFWGMTLRLVPEFRQEGIILLDYEIKWHDFLNYKWFLEEVIEIEYEQGEVIKSFKTSIPPEDQLIVEDLLRSKMMEKVSDNDE
jgi:hypothetical protein